MIVKLRRVVFGVRLNKRDSINRTTDSILLLLLNYSKTQSGSNSTGTNGFVYTQIYNERKERGKRVRRRSQ
jgi:hypothetical protein